ncbi:arsenosugar biosynthesis radical SAM (seleno)protein ArsS [Belliella aquatica]|uniref:Radical SAM/Cys-rich domain protein n=1 Tax=Belliella aquatica TaxID=1323734 RepID=A0ABQ1LV84_9BACT|nr:arsenosugar biosynthesis radical SAM (seleno)protein ArsS [Belliella aquatica]MCH7405875.1 arsenosugar biosynthesis radical SAM protein ArsS [Belliella aquatica]GGC30027.1 radical SAM/Cys-rich domain protein [Belliella aquatica]
MKSLKAQQHPLSKIEYELEVLDAPIKGISFADKLAESDLFPLKPTQIDVLQINMGKMCNQVCKHCHVDAGPDRKEIMTRETMQHCLEVIKNGKIKSVDLTGGAPEMNPEFRWFIEEIRKISFDIQIIVRCNLTIILANPKYHDLPEFYRKNKIEVVSSLPYFTAVKTDSQRGDGVFEKSIKALKMLNEVGYGMENSDLVLNLVYNPSGAFLPAAQEGLELEFKKRLKNGYEIEFNSLFTITNLPISRFLEYLLRSENYDNYMEKLLEAYNPVAASNVMCRNTISVGWDGYLYDCDFNQMLELKVDAPSSQHISEWNQQSLLEREIILKQHCFGCTAGAGSSCGGATA